MEAGASCLVHSRIFHRITTFVSPSKWHSWIAGLMSGCICLRIMPYDFEFRKLPAPIRWQVLKLVLTCECASSFMKYYVTNHSVGTGSYTCQVSYCATTVADDLATYTIYFFHNKTTLDLKVSCVCCFEIMNCSSPILCRVRRIGELDLHI